MYAQVEKQKENKSRAVANSVSQKKSNTAEKFCFVDNREKQTLQLRQIANTPNPNSVDVLAIIRNWAVAVGKDFQAKHLDVSRGESGARLVSGKTTTPINTTIISDGETLCRLVQQGIAGGIIGAFNGSPQVTAPVTLTVQEHESALQKGKKGKGPNNHKGLDKVNTGGSGDVEKLVYLTCLIDLSNKQMIIHHYNGGNQGNQALAGAMAILKGLKNTTGDKEIKQL